LAPFIVLIALRTASRLAVKPPSARRNATRTSGMKADTPRASDEFRSVLRGRDAQAARGKLPAYACGLERDTEPRHL
jgi:hypothetical protein